MTTAALPIVRTIAALRQARWQWRKSGARVGLVPTMGALHDGHLSLVTLLKQHCDVVATSIFINPTQFAAHEDLSRYPRDESGDAAKLASVGCDLIFTPDPSLMYPQGFSTSVAVSGVSADLEGAHRPQMFGGVATVVTKLFNQVAPDVAAFGEKDFQQLLVIRRLVRDLDMPIEILAGATVREADGLAMSSRNAYLNAEHRQIAPSLHRALQSAREALRAGAVLEPALQAATQSMIDAGFSLVDYVALRDGEDFSALSAFDAARPARLLAAAHLGGTRLIDNIAV